MPALREWVGKNRLALSIPVAGALLFVLAAWPEASTSQRFFAYLLIATGIAGLAELLRTALQKKDGVYLFQAADWPSELIKKLPWIAIVGLILIYFGMRMLNVSLW